MIPYRLNVDENGFDELVVGNCALHVEMMDKRVMWLAVYHPNGKDRWAFNVTMDAKGNPKSVTMTEEPL